MTYHDWVSCVLESPPTIHEYAVRLTVRAMSEKLGEDVPPYFSEALRYYLTARQAYQTAADQVFAAAELCGVRRR